MSYSRVKSLRLTSLRRTARRGTKKAILAAATFMLTAAYYMLRDGVDYQDLGPDHKSKTIRRLLNRLADLGSNVDQIAHAT